MKPSNRKKLYGLTAGACIFCGLLVFAIYPALIHADSSVVFLRTTFPSSPLIEADMPEGDVPCLIAEDTENRLVLLLSEDDFPYEAPRHEEQWQVVRMRITGYCSCPKCCGKFSDGKTACNYRIRRGDVFVAADKRHPFGTEMIIPGYNNAQPVKVLDRGSAIQGNRLDVYFDSHQQAKKWGVKYLDVLIKNDK